VTTHERQGALMDWQMIGTFSAEEDKALAAKPDFSPQTRAEVKINGDSWEWRSVQARANGMLTVGRSQPSPNAPYADACFARPLARRTAVPMGSANGLPAWPNGKQVYEFKGKRPYLADADLVEVEVKKGTNTVLLKMFDEGPVWKTPVRPSPIGLYPPPA